MNRALYRHLLRQLLLFPFTFSRNKNFDTYHNDEGAEAIDRARILRQFKELLYNIHQYKYEGEINADRQYCISFFDETLNLTRTFFIDPFEWKILKEELRCRSILTRYFPDF